MKDINKLKDYRLKYKRYYGIDFNSDYVIHHIDLNHNNNDIDNLILLPKELHERYHFYLSFFGSYDGIINFNAKINVNFEGGHSYHLLKLCETLEEIKKWKNYKLQLEMNRQAKNSEVVEKWKNIV